MSHTPTPHTAVTSRRREPDDAGCGSRVLYCLVLSADSARRKVLEWGALEAGWQTLSGLDASSAGRQLARTQIQLAVVDLADGTPQDQAAFRTLLETIVGRPGLLVVVCGRENDWREEVWARQLGVWIYLAGQLDVEGMSTLCGEALHIVRRLDHAVQSAPRESGPAAQQTRV